jgi:hypothetical protein
MIPADYLAAYEKEPPPPLELVGGPLPDLVTHHYSSGGCFILAAALHQATDLPIELYYRQGEPKHAYITDGLRALDVRGVLPVVAVRAGAEQIAQVTLGGLVAVLQTLPAAEHQLADLRRPRSQVAAERTADALLRHTRFAAP